MHFRRQLGAHLNTVHRQSTQDIIMLCNAMQDNTSQSPRYKSTTEELTPTKHAKDIIGEL